MKPKAKRHDAFARIQAGLHDAIAHAEGRKSLTVRDVQLPDPPTPMTPTQIVSLRTTILGVSQQVFAKMVNASLQTVHAWEQGRVKPSGPALRFLRIIERRPDVIGELVKR